MNAMMIVVCALRGQFVVVIRAKMDALKGLKGCLPSGGRCRLSDCVPGADLARAEQVGWCGELTDAPISQHRYVSVRCGALQRPIREPCCALRRAQTEYPVVADLVVVINDTRQEDVRLSNARSTGSEQAPQQYIRLRTLKGHGNVRYGAGQNRALETVSSDYHLILNPDVFLEKGRVLEGLRYLDEHAAEVAMLVPQGFDPQNEYARLSKRHPSLLVLLLVRLQYAVPIVLGRVARYTYGGELPCDAPKSITLASGCFMLCRTDTLRK